jgi:hypothetical protein
MTSTTNINEETYKVSVAHKYFGNVPYETLHGIDFCLRDAEGNFLLWAEAKKDTTPVDDMVAQLYLTIGLAKEKHKLDNIEPPPFLAVFNNEKIVFIPYPAMQDILYSRANLFNWKKVRPSNYKDYNHATAVEHIVPIVAASSYEFYFNATDGKLLQEFIRNTLKTAYSGKGSIRIDRYNFDTIYKRWLREVKPLIDIDWNGAKKDGIQECEFYLADLFVDDNDTVSIDDDISVAEGLHIIFKDGGYRIDKAKSGRWHDDYIKFVEGGKAKYERFWKIYKRPPYSDHKYIKERRDLLIQQDVREYKGAYFTPRRWVKLSQEYLAKAFGHDWQDEYYIWDCACGTGNLLAGLTDKFKIFASDYDQSNIDVIHEMIDKGGATLLKDHVFRFDFLNDDFAKLPERLRGIINDSGKRKQLIIYINPPYAEATDMDVTTGKKAANKTDVALNNKTHAQYAATMGKAGNEVFAQFLMRIYKEIDGCKIGNFSTLKILNAPNFKQFRQSFQPKLKNIFIVPAYTFDNVNGTFPIGFHIWDTAYKEPFDHIVADVLDEAGNLVCRKKFYSYAPTKYINDWLKAFKTNDNKSIGCMYYIGNDFQNSHRVNINSQSNLEGHYVKFHITKDNLLPACIYFAVRHCIKRMWLNDRDQFLYPGEGWRKDLEFHNDCLAFTLFSGSNNISSAYGVNHWIPFTEQEVDARDNFNSHFMVDYIAGKILPSANDKFFTTALPQQQGMRVFSQEAQKVLDAGRELWKYYHSCIKKEPAYGKYNENKNAPDYANVNASYYDIRGYFKGFSYDAGKGKPHMRTKSPDATFNTLDAKLREGVQALAGKIAHGAYQYGFLKK